MSDPTSDAERLKPYVPRLVIDWLREAPDTRHRRIEGSLAFVDVSGFTQLTEKLARKGKVGAEEVSDTLQSVFSQLIDVAYEYGAGLLKWGGDALLLLFDGDGHAARCCRAAAGMQATLERIGRLRTSGGTVVLRMSVGIHSGTFDFFLLGDSHRELIVTGPAASGTVAMEALAEAGEIAISPATAELVDARHVGPPKEDAFLLAGAPDVPIEPTPDVGDVSDVDLPSCIATELRKQLVVEQGEAEHRMVSVGFLQFSGTDELLSRAGPDALADGLDELLSRVQEACDRYGVTFFATDINRDGGKIILVTGAPWSGGDDEDRLLRAVRMIMDRPGEIAARIGVNSGRAFTCDFGPPYRRAYQMYGDAVNLAARVMAKGEPGQVLATTAILSCARTAYELEELEPFMVKGKSEPVTASVLGAAAGAKEVSRGGAPLVGREEEMAVLLAAADSARRGAGRVVELIGGPGIGKSRLVDELEACSPDLASFWAVCEQYESSTPYFPFRGLLREVLGIPRDAAPDEAERALRERVAAAAPALMPWLPLLGTTLGVELAATPETSRLEERFIPERTAEVVEELLSSLRGKPTLFVLDDVHWLDEASVGVLTRLAEHALERPWLLLVTRREAETGFAAAAAPHVAALRPAPLTGDAAAELAKATTEDVPLPPHVLEALAERSGGNPLFLNELIAASLAGASLEDLPDTVEALMAAQIDRLEPRERTVLRYAAVLGASFETDLLEDALQEEIPALADDVWSRLADFLGEDEPGVLRFRHALIRDAAYEGLPYRRRRALHERVGETIESRAGPSADDEAERLSLHYFHAGELDKAWRYSRLAGERAAAIYANVDAAAFFERALAAARRQRTVSAKARAGVLEALGDVALRLGEFEKADAAYRASRRSASGDALEEARLLEKEALVPCRQERYQRGFRRLNRALRHLEEIESPDARAQRARLYALCAGVRQHQHRAAEATEWCWRAIAEAELTDARDALAQAYFTLDWAYLKLGRMEEAVYSPRAIEIYEELGDLDRLASVLINRGLLAYLSGRWDEAIELEERARQALETIGDRASACVAQYNVAEFLFEQGRIDEAEPLFRDVLRICKAAGNVHGIALATSALGRVAARTGQFDVAQGLLEEAHALHEAEGDEVELLIDEARLVECLVLRSESADVLALAAAAARRAETLEGVSMIVAQLHRLRGWAFMQLQELEQAREALEESLEITSRADSNFGLRSPDYERASTLDALAQLARLTAEPAEELEAERDALGERLGLVAIPAPPLPGVAVAP